MNTHRTSLSTRLLAVVAMAFMLFPLLTVIPVSFTSKRFLSMPQGNWSLRHYEALMSNPDWFNAISQSLTIAFATSIIATLLAASFSLGIWYMRSKWATALIGLVLLPMAIPFITSVNVDTLPKRIWSGLRDNVDPSMAAISVLLISLTLLVLIGRLVAQHLADKRAQKLLHP